MHDDIDDDDDVNIFSIVQSNTTAKFLTISTHTHTHKQQSIDMQQLTQ